MSTLLLSVMGAFAEFERALIRERQREGIAVAKKRGVYKGRKKTLTPIEVLDLHRRNKDGEKLAALAREARVSRQTLYRYFGELEAAASPKTPASAAKPRPSATPTETAETSG